MRHLLFLLLVFFAWACSPNSEAPVAVMVLVPNGGVFEPQQQQLTTISDISKLEGSIAHFIGGARMIEKENNSSQSEGGSVRAQFIEKDGVLWPADFHSWAMTTAYWNLEQAFLYFQKIYDSTGRGTAELLNLPVYYWLDTNIFSANPEGKSDTDNAFYAGGGNRFMSVLPFGDFQTIPMAINLGVMAHEYAHFVLDSRVHHAVLHSPAYVNSDKAMNILESINEGLADFHAYGVIRKVDGQGVPNYLGWSLDDKDYVNERDFSSGEKCMVPNLRNALEADYGAFRANGLQYQLGTLFAASFYHASLEEGDFDTLAQAIIRAYDNDDNNNPGIRQHYANHALSPHDITLESVADVFLNHIPPGDLRKSVCAQMLHRLELEICETVCKDYYFALKNPKTGCNDFSPKPCDDSL